MQLTASSADGSVYGKKSGRKRVRMRSSSNSARTNVSMVPNRSARVMPRSTTSASIWWNTGEWRGVERLVAVGAAGRDHEDRRLHRLHRADLHRRRVGAQQHLLGLAELDVERVLHRAGRDAPGTMLSASKLCQSSSTSGPSIDAVAHAHEDVLELALHLGDEVEVPARPTVAAEREVEPVALAGRAGLGGRRARRALASTSSAIRALDSPTALPAAGRSAGSRSLIASLSPRASASRGPASCALGGGEGVERSSARGERGGGVVEQ